MKIKDFAFVTKIFMACQLAGLILTVIFPNLILGNVVMFVGFVFAKVFGFIKKQPIIELILDIIHIVLFGLALFVDSPVCLFIFLFFSFVYIFYHFRVIKKFEEDIKIKEFELKFLDKALAYMEENNIEELTPDVAKKIFSEMEEDLKKMP